MTAFTPVINAILYIGLTVVVGAVSLRYILLPRTGLNSAERTPEEQLAAAGGVLGAAMILLATVARATLQVALLMEPGDPWLPMYQAVLLTTTLGKALQLQAIWAAAAMMGFSIAKAGREKGWKAAAVATVILCITPGMGGHSAASDTPGIALTAAALHVLGAGVWIGTLFHVWRSSRVASTSTLREFLRAFHAIALTAAVILVLSGLYQTWNQLGDISNLVRAPWGRILAVKLILVAVTAVFGYRHWKTSEALADEATRPALRKSIRSELGFALLVLITTAILATSAPPG